ncbi:MAG: zinc ABC transporter substrate-binding protein [Nitrospirae bacterium]|nr:zinc ABC transporter substrate-binding protein [Nitrospirota bacterium]
MVCEIKTRRDRFIGFPIFTILFLSLLFSASSCEKKTQKINEEKRIKVITTLFPLYDFAKNIGKHKVDVILLLPPGIEPHSFEPKPKDILKINNADIFVYTGKFMEPWVEDILKGIGERRPLIVDSSKGIILTENGDGKNEYKTEHLKVDPHIWLDFSKAQRIVDNILNGFIEKDVENREFYLKNATKYKTRLKELDAKFEKALSLCKKETIIYGGHFAFGYLTKRYKINYLSAYKGFSPEAEPTPKDLIELINKLKEYNTNYIFYEELLNPKVAEILAKETGAKILMLHGAHNITKEDFNRNVDFISLMEHNLKNLIIGLECK